MMYVTPARDKAVFYWWKIANFHDQHFPRAVMAGLDPEKTYTVHELNRIDITPLPYEGKSFSGRFLMENGLEIPASNNVEHSMKSDWSSRVLYLTSD